MYNLTKIKIHRPAKEVFEAFVDPLKIGNFWFSSSSKQWVPGQTVTLRYDEYGAQGDIQIVEMEDPTKIVFRWGSSGEGNLVAIQMKELNPVTTVVEVSEEGFNQSGDELIHVLLDNKEGWVYTLTCLKAYLESGVNTLRAALVKD